MATIKAPFNFVPLSEKVFFPDWADKISQDIPFEDGESGTIELKITAESPIFIRNGHTKGEAENKTDSYKSFSNIDGKYFIPGTTIKGAIRNVLEIISFGKMSQINNHRYSLRDINLKDEYLNFFQPSSVHCGWMTKKENSITITNNGIPKRISHLNLDELWKTTFVDKFSNPQYLKEDSHRTALHKIQLSKNYRKNIRYDEFLMNSVNPVDTRIIANPSKNGKNEGTIVLTGQPAARKDRDKTRGGKGSGKCFEFVFPETTEGNPFCFDIEDELYSDFFFIYKDSDDWNYWKKELEAGNAVPIFFSLKDNKLIHFGLSYLYKLPYKHRIKDCLPKEHKSPDFDLSACLFGFSSTKVSLRGRVQFSNAFLQRGDIDNELLAYMSSPKSSYYPIYLQQLNGEEGLMSKSFITMMSDKARLKGWKRYPIREGLMDFRVPMGQESNRNPFIPLKEGSEFKCYIRFHNLKKVEIGALLKAINFSYNGFHSIGFAKPHGYGKVKIEVKINNCNFPVEEYMKSFTSLMEANITNYSKSVELNELNLMSVNQSTTSPLEYMELKDFSDCKRIKKNKKGEIEQPGEYLEYFSKLIKRSIKSINVNETAEAEVTQISGNIILAKLLEGKDISAKSLKIENGNRRPKKNNKIIVRVIRKGGNIDYLVLKSITK